MSRRFRAPHPVIYQLWFPTKIELVINLKTAKTLGCPRYSTALTKVIE